MTGEVVTGTEERLATGDAVNVAARLEQAAHPGEVLLGAPTLTLVRDAVEVEPVEPLELKGKAEPVPAYRLLRVREVPERRYEALFVGRQRELANVREAWGRVRRSAGDARSSLRRGARASRRSARRAGRPRRRHPARDGERPHLHGRRAPSRRSHRRCSIRRRRCRLFDELGERGFLSTASGNLAQALYALDRLEEADAWADRAAELGASADAITQMLWRQVRAKVLARRGGWEEAERLAREAVAIGQETDLLNQQADACADLGEVLLLAGKSDEAVAALEQAVERYERKGNIVSTQRSKERIAEIRAEARVSP